MKKISRALVALLLVLPFNLLAQIELDNTNLKHNHLAVLYAGVVNTIEIKGIKDGAGLVLKASSGIIEKESSTRFIMSVNTEKNDTLRLYQKGKLILTKVYEIKTLSSVITQLGYISTPRATVNEILAYPELVAFFPKCDYNLKLFVIGFKLYIHNSKNVALLNYEYNSGGKLTIKQLEDIKPLKHGDKLIFEDIKIRVTGECPRNINPISITIK